MTLPRQRTGLGARSAGSLTGLLLLAVVAALVPTIARANSLQPRTASFYTSSLSVIPGTQVTLHWDPEPGAIYVLTSAAPNALPGFGQSAITWPAETPAVWNSTWEWWSSAATAVSVSIPPGATDGTKYEIELYTCNATFSECSNTESGSGYSAVTLTVTTTWQSVPYRVHFPIAETIAESVGQPLDTVFSSDGSVWNSSEFSAGVSQATAGTSNGVYYPDPATVLSFFAACFWGPCFSTYLSALSEQIVDADGLIWATLGGWLFDSSRTIPNRSAIVAFNPISKSYCTYIVPGNNSEVTGLAVTGTWPQSRAWFVESSVTSGHPFLDSFNPATVGDGCPGTADEVYSLAGALTRVAWPANDFPAQIAPEADSAALWVTDFLGSEIDRVDTNTGEITRYFVPVRNRYSALGSGPWQIVADQGYVYAINYADSTLVRINKANGQLDAVPIPVTSDVEQGYGLALSRGTLYFTLSDDRQPNFGAASTFGYVSTAAWEGASSTCSPRGTDCAPAPRIAGVYTGIGGSGSDFRGIAVGPSNRVAIADRHAIVLLTP